MDKFINFIIQAILGGASGYITNDYAINMLFKEYTPLKIGGVIKKTRNEFIDNLSSLVENDIINKDKLKEILLSDNFNNKFEDLTKDFYTSSLYEKVGEKNFFEVNGIDLTINKTEELVEKITDEHLNELLDILFKNLNIEEFLNNKQLDYISNNLYNSIINMVENTDVAKELFSSLYKSLKGIKIKQLITNDSDETINKISTSISNSINNVIKNQNLDLVIDKFTSDDSNILLNIKESISNKELKDIVNLDEEFKINIINNFKEFVNSENGHEILYNISSNIFSQLEKNQYTLYEMLDSSFETNLEKYLSDNLPKITDSLVEWVEVNSKDIDFIIDSSIDEIIQESDGIKRKLLATLKSNYFNNLGEKISIVDKITDYILQVTRPDDLSNALSSKIIELLNNITIGKLTNYLKTNNVFTPELAVNNINIYLNKNSDSILNIFFDYFLSLKVKDVIPESFDLNLKDLLKNQNLISNKNINKILIKLLNASAETLLDKDNFDNSKFLLNLIKNNSEIIETFIKNSIKKADTNKLKEGADKKKASQLLNKVYINSSAKLKETKISTTLDRINEIDDLYKKSAKYVRNYTIDNLDNILGGSIKGIVASNLNKLSDDELVKFANDFIGRELKPIMYFGGVLGTAAGILLAVFQNPPPQPGAITIENMITYAFVGYLTNVIAIRMIFKPYKENKFLSKIPFFRNFSLGYIVKNQKIFAENTSYFVVNKLLTKESINELFNQYEDNIKQSFTKSISYNDYYIVNQLVDNNKNILVNNAFKYTKNSLYNNYSFYNYIYDYVGNINIISLLSDDNINNISDTSSLWIRKNYKNISKEIKNKVTSKNSLYDDLSHDLINNFKSSALNYENKYAEITMFLEEQNLKRYVNKYNDKFKNWSKKPVSEIIKSETLDNITLNVSKKIAEIIVSSNTRQSASNAISNMVNKYIENDKTFSKIFNGKIKDYLDNKLPEIYNNLISLFKKSIKDQKGAITLNVQKEIKNSLGMLEKGMYSLMDGDGLIDKLISRIITVKVPEYIDSKKNELENIYLSSLYNFYNTKVNDIINNFNKTNINNMVEDFFENEESKEFLADNISFNANLIKDKISQNNLDELLSIISLNDLTVLYDKYEEEINILCNNLSQLMISNKEEIVLKLNKVITNIIDEFLKSTSLNDLFEYVTLEEIDSVVLSILQIIDKDDQIKKTINRIIENYKNYAQFSKVTNFVDKEEFVKSTEKYINNVVMSDDTEILIKKIYTELLNEAVSSNFSFIDNDTKSFLLNIFIESSIASIRNNLDDILKSIELDKLAKEEIEKMEPEKIHNMFNSFAGKYFTRLKLYGFGGFVFGINTYAGLSLTGVKILSEIKSKNEWGHTSSEK